MKIIKTAAFKTAQSTMDAPALPTHSHPITPQPHQQQPSQQGAEFEVSSPQEIAALQEAIDEKVSQNASVFQEGFGHDQGFHNMGYNHEVSPFSVTVRAVPPMTADDLPYTLRGTTNAESPDGAGNAAVNWEAEREFGNDPQVATYRVS